MEITTIGVDLAKTVFQVHGMNAHGKTVVRKRLSRDKFLASSPTFHRAWWPWKPVVPAISGRGTCRLWAMTPV